MKRLFLALLVIFSLNACTTAPVPPMARGPMAPAPIKKRPPPPVAKSYPLPETPPPSVRPQAPTSPLPPPAPAGAESAPPAVVALIQQAEIDRQQGNLDQAASRIERALRIQPQNPKLWHTLAKIRLEQHQPRLAEELAKKSISLSGDKELLRRNWLLIAEARRMNGDAPGASLAEQEARRY
jgi:tetratricopeptide (TPR) repeat protein